MIIKLEIKKIDKGRDKSKKLKWNNLWYEKYNENDFYKKFAFQTHL